MALEDRKTWGEVRRTPPTAYPDGATAPASISPTGDQYVQATGGSKMWTSADRGQYFTAVNTTPGTAIAGITAADGIDDLEALLFMRVASTATKRVHLDKLWLRCVAVGTNGTDFQLALRGDKGNSRYASGGSSFTGVNTNMADGTASVVDQLKFGAVVTTAATSSMRTLWHKRLRSTIKVTLDEYLFNFGSSNSIPFTSVPAATVGALVTDLPPVVLGAGDSLLLHEFAASQTVAASYEFFLSWVER